MRNMLLSFILLISVCSTVSSAQEIPFMEMAGKNYADCTREITDVYSYFFQLDTIEMQKVVSQFEEFVQTTGSLEWRLQTDYFTFTLLRKKNSACTSNEMVQQALDLLERLQKAKMYPLEVKLRHDLIGIYQHEVNNYELALEQCDTQAQRLRTVSVDEIPEKVFYDIQIARMYYDFKDYLKAITHCKIILNDKDNWFSQWYKQEALNVMGLSYRYGFNDLDRSDSCFYAILNTTYNSSNSERDRY